MLLLHVNPFWIHKNKAMLLYKYIRMVLAIYVYVFYILSVMKLLWLLNTEDILEVKYSIAYHFNSNIKGKSGKVKW